MKKATVAKRAKKETVVSNVAKKAKKETKPKCMDLIRLKLAIEACTTPIWTIDPGTSAPGWLRFDPITKRITMYFYRKRQEERSNEIRLQNEMFNDWILDIRCLEHPTLEDAKPFGSFTRTSMIQAMIQPIIRCIQAETQIVDVVIEDYAFSARNASSTGMFEFGGIMRSMLSNSGHRVHELPISTNKKWFTGHGKCHKSDMYNTFVNSYKMPDLLSLIGISYTHFTSTPKPVEDLIDAFSFLCVFIYHNAVLKQRMKKISAGPKKRKRSESKMQQNTQQPPKSQKKTK